MEVETGCTSDYQALVITVDSYLQAVVRNILQAQPIFNHDGHIVQSLVSDTHPACVALE